MSRKQRVWVVLDRIGGKWIPLLWTVARTRRESVEFYEQNRDAHWVVGGGYAEDKRNGWVRCVTATLTPKANTKRKKQPKGQR